LYKLLLCWRYLLTRYLALACIISVMLGVATLIVVNSVMSGFSTKLRERLHGLLSDILVEARSMDGFTNPEEKMARIRQDPFLRDQVIAMTPTMEVFAMLQFRLSNGEYMTRPVRLIGIDPKTRSQVGGFKDHLLNQKDQSTASFELSEEAKESYLRRNLFSQPLAPVPEFSADPSQPPPPTPPPSQLKMPRGVIVGNLIASYRDKNQTDRYVMRRGDTVILTTVSGQRLAPVYDSFVIVDFFKSEMSEYDSNYVFVPLDYLQHLRTMPDRVTSIQIKLKDYGQVKQVKEALQRLFPASQGFTISTWEDKQGALLQAINIEKGILNILLFLIIGVAGFGILAIFSLIVKEKTRDIGILKALGASSRGVLAIFLGYGFLLGTVGAGLGTMLGVTLSDNINEIEQKLARWTGQTIFDRTVYYFDKIPTDIQPLSVALVAVGAVLIAVVFSVLPALRAALLHPVRALRYE
jgi:lipoprotein-releasing system permease protein